MLWIAIVMRSGVSDGVFLSLSCLAGVPPASLPAQETNHCDEGVLFERRVLAPVISLSLSLSSIALAKVFSFLVSFV